MTGEMALRARKRRSSATSRAVDVAARRRYGTPSRTEPTLALATRGANVAAQGALLVGMCLYAGWVASADSGGIELLGLLLLVAVALALAVPPYFFVALALLIFGAYSVVREPCSPLAACRCTRPTRCLR